MKKKKKIVALIYDFDNTLINCDMQNITLAKELAGSVEAFWARANGFMIDNDVDEVLSYLYMSNVMAKEKGIKFTKKYLAEHGKKINAYFAGVETWFDRINAYASDMGVELKHYVISAGFQDMVDNCSIAKNFEKIFACRYVYDASGEVLWPAYVVNYSQKIQYIARIRKNLTENLRDSKGVNTKVGKKDQYISYDRMIYLGDGVTDVPGMKMIKQMGGYSICVYDKTKESAKRLLRDKRVDYVVPADYTEGSLLDKRIKYIIKNMK